MKSHSRKGERLLRSIYVSDTALKARCVIIAGTLTPASAHAAIVMITGDLNTTLFRLRSSDDCRPRKEHRLTAHESMVCPNHTGQHGDQWR